ncbi:myosin phosphatase Rho-interacting protein-like isoform X1 [Xiphophorus maculatus]|uniref:Myosin phosphatase Rho-interacting protein-like n=1 Tax=Xiphophorus maculatus TaxID=8083 RepID=A0A3B5PRY3_XIPMA|nr:myosin phosphatase Rho-interacting protein-like isoform X1 [Xiphophorus maculatus]
MSGDKATGSCRRFQPNVFSKSKCQNCFKSREVHPLNDSDLEQAKPVYAGWLCLAPEGTDFDNPAQRSRKWQRRFFILYEHGRMTYALDELPNTLPQGTINMNLCTGVTDAEPWTGQRNALCIATATQEVFIRGDSREIISGWGEQLTAYLSANKQQKKKRSVDSVANQDPSPANMAAAGRSNPASAAGPARPDVPPVRTVTRTDSLTSDSVPTQPGPASSLTPVTPVTSGGAGRLAAGRYDQNQNQSRSLDRSAEQQLGPEIWSGAQRGGGAECGAGSRTDRTAGIDRTAGREKLRSTGDGSLLSVPAPQSRTRSLDRRTADGAVAAMTPVLLNFKKGWMMKLDEDDEWRKYWFVLSTASLRFYRDSSAEEASDPDGEIDLSKFYSVSEYQVQRNYGFQIHTQKAVFTLSAMTAGIRRNWIQALMKNVNPADAPDVASLPGRRLTCSPAEVGPYVAQDSASCHAPTPSGPASSSESDQSGVGAKARLDGVTSYLELGDLERLKRREERRRRYESLLGFPLGRGGPQGGATRPLSPQSQLKMEERIAKCWRQVERTALRPERTVALPTESRDTLETEMLLQDCRTLVDDLKAQLAGLERRRLQLEDRLRAARFCPEQMDLLVPFDPIFHPADWSLTLLNDSGWLFRDLLQQRRDRLQQRKELLQQHSNSSSAACLSGIWIRLPVGDSAETDGLVLAAAAAGGQQGAPQADWRDPDIHAAVKSLTQEVALLSSQNRALDQHNQEMLDQLTEADREIDRLRAELGRCYNEPLRRNQELLSASLEVLLRLKHSAEPNGPELQLEQSERTCRKPEQENTELKETTVEDVTEEKPDQNQNQNQAVSAEENIQEVTAGAGMRLQALAQLLEVIDGLDLREEEEEEFWKSDLNKMKSDPARLQQPIGEQLEQQLEQAGHALLHPEEEEEEEEESFVWGRVSENRRFTDELRGITLSRISCLNRLAASGRSAACDRLQSAADKLSSSHLASSAEADAFCCVRLSRLRSRYQRRVCSSCSGRMEEIQELNTGPEDAWTTEDAQVSISCQTDGGQRSTAAGSEEMLHLEQNETPLMRPQETQQSSDLRAEGETLQEELRRMQEQHRREVAQLKASCERAFITMETCHLGVVEELQRLHQQEVQCLLVERDRLLEEESAATATAIEAIKKAHRAELQTEIQRRSQSENCSRNSQLEEIHREELASFQLELDVLSQQFSIKCLENRHLVQAVEAERKALGQCRQENRALRSRNQELSRHLAAEITRLCSVAQQEQPPRGQTGDSYEVEVTLRVQEAEVQSLKQEVASLKDELQAAVKDQRNAAQKYLRS